MQEIGRIIADRLKTLRHDAGLTQKEVADVLGISRVSMTSWEGGVRTPSIDNLRQLADLYRVNLDYLAARTDRKEMYTKYDLPPWDPKDEDWDAHPDCPLEMKALREDGRFKSHLNNPRARTILAGLVEHHDIPSREYLLRFMEYAMVIDHLHSEKEESLTDEKTISE